MLTLQKSSFVKLPNGCYELTLTGDEWLNHIPLNFAFLHDRDGDGVAGIQSLYHATFADRDRNGMPSAGDTLEVSQPSVKNLGRGESTEWSERDTAADLARLAESFYRR